MLTLDYLNNQSSYILNYLRYFSWLLALGVPYSLIAQSDTLTLVNGRVLVGSYKESYNHQQVENKANFKEIYQSKDVHSLATAKKYYRPVQVATEGEISPYMAERLVNSEVNLYGVDFPVGYFNAISVAQSFFYFEKDGVFTYVNQANLEGFYATYFGNCYGWIPDKKLHYSEGSIIKMLNAYNKCLNPNAKEQAVEPTVSEMNLVVFGGFGSLSHYPLNTAFNDGRFKDRQRHLGLGLNFVIHRKVVLGLEANHSSHSVISPVFLLRFLGNGPMRINSFAMLLCQHLQPRDAEPSLQRRAEVVLHGAKVVEFKANMPTTNCV